ncbi:hypothetical protein K1719_038986 [Acacia pycnantha]|nr:hypothetical protein K1719_038986 [Acacia pycnantha]
MINVTFIIIFLAALALCSYNLGGFFMESSFSESCGHVFNLPTNTRRYINCYDPSYALHCENNTSTVLYVNYGRHLVEAIYASNNSSTTLRSITAGVDINNCSSITHQSLTYNNFTNAFTAKVREHHDIKSKRHHPIISKKYNYDVGGLLFVSCKNQLSTYLYRDIVALCSSEEPKTRYSYLLTGDPRINNVEESCKIEMMVKIVPWGPITCNEKCSYPQVQSQEVLEF